MAGGFRSYQSLWFGPDGMEAGAAPTSRKRQRRRWKWHQSWSAGILAVIVDKLAEWL